MSSMHDSKSAMETFQKSGEDLTFFMSDKCTLEGARIIVDGVARINGELSGNLKARHVIVGENAHVTGYILGETGDIMGSVEERVVFRGKLLLRSSGQIKGELTYAGLQVESGGRIVGNISHHDANPS